MAVEGERVARALAAAPVLETTSCPECGELAEVLWRAVMESTDGPVEHAKIACVSRHWFLLPVARSGRG